MPHGGPDWGLMGPKTINYGLDDMAELAARLGSPVSFDRRGDVLFFDDFTEGVAAWEWGCGGIGCGRELTRANALTAPYAVLLRPGNSDGDNSFITHVMYYPQLGGIGTQVSYMPVNHSEWMCNHLLIFDGTTVTRYYADYNHQTGWVEIYIFPDTWVQVANVGVQREAYNCFFTYKMVVDASTGKYLRLLFNGREWNISQYTADHDPDATAASMTLELLVTVDGDNVIEPVVDRVVVTQNEPIGD